VGNRVVWRKAARSASSGECVEVGTDASDGRMLGLIRDSKSPERGYLTTTPAMLGELLATIKRGELD
jgi:hypothetical protein